LGSYVLIFNNSLVNPPIILNLRLNFKVDFVAFMIKKILFACLFILGGWGSINSVKAQCNAVITANTLPAQGCDPFTIQLFDQSTGFVANRIWDFGDGTQKSGAQNPIHTFNGYGRDTTYQVVLKTYCLNGDSSTASLNVTVYAIPNVNFKADTTIFCALSDTVCFLNLSDQQLGYTYLWNFGDNTSSSLAAPCKTYPTEGIFSVGLTVINNHGCQNSINKSNYITTRRAPNPDFTLSAFMGCAPFSVNIVNMTNTNNDTIAGWLWSFGDGSPDLTVKDPISHTYNIDSSYSISLQAVNNLGCSNKTTRSLIVKPTPQGSFTLPPGACVNNNVPITFTGNVPNGTNYTWNFGGGTVVSGTGAGPYQISFPASGIPVVTLTVELNGCSSTITNSLQVAPQPPVFLFNNVNDSVCAGSSVTFIAQPSGYPTYSFSVNNSLVQSGTINSYTVQQVQAGASVSVEVTDFNGCKNQTTTLQPLIVKANPQIHLVSLSGDTLCQGDTAKFLATPDTLDLYQFLNGFAPIQYGQSDTLIIPNVQTSLNIFANGYYKGCSSKTDSVSTTVVIKKLDAPIVNCGASTDNSVSFIWDSVLLANGYQVSVNGLPYTLPSSGNNGLTHLVSSLNSGDSVTIKVLPTGGYCGNGFPSSTKTCYARPCDLINYALTASSLQVCEGSSITASLNSVTIPNYQVSWQHGAYSNQTNGQYVINNDTTITVSIKNTDQLNCPVSTKSIVIQAVKTPPVSLTTTDDTLCLGNSVTVNASPTTYANYLFLNGYAPMQSSGNPVLTFSPTTSGNNTIKVIASTNGCADTAQLSFPIVVKNPLPAPQLNCSTSTQNSVSFVWDTIQGALGYEISINGSAFGSPTSGNMGSTHVINGLNPNDAVTAIIKALGSAPCSDSYYSLSATCYAKSCTAINFSTATNYTVCESASLNLQVSNISIPNYQVSWNNGGFGSALTHAYNATQTATIPVSVKNVDEPGCPNANKYITVQVVPTPTVNLSLSQDTVCYGQPITFTASPLSYPNYVFVNGYTILQQGANPQFTSGSLTNGNSVKVVANNQGCVDTSNIVTVVVKTPLAVPQPNCGTTTSSTISFNWDSIYQSTGYQISVDGGNTFANPSSGANGLTHIVNGLNSNDSVTIIVKALGKQPCGNSVVSSAITCYARNCTGINFTLNAPSNACENEVVNASISGITISPFEANWQNTTYSTNTTYTQTATATYIQTVTVKNPSQPTCPTVTKTKTIAVQPKVNITLTSTALRDTICQGEVISISASPTNYQNYEFVLNGTTIQNSANPSVMLNQFMTGVNQIIVKPTQNSCQGNQASLNYHYYPTPVLSFSNSISPDSVCNGSSITVTVTPNNLANYNFMYNNLVVQNGNNNVLTFTPTNIGNNNQLIIKAINAGGCINKPDTIMYHVEARPTINLTASTTDSICKGQAVVFTASPTGVHNYKFYLNNVLAQSNSANSYSNSHLQTNDSVYAYAINSYGCVSNKSNILSFVIKAAYQPSINIADSTAICKGTSLTLTATVASAPSGLTYSWNTGQVAPSITVSPTATTNYYAYTIYKGCVSVADTVKVKIDNQTPPQATAGSGSTICKGDSIKLTGTGGNNYAWYDNSGHLLGSSATIYVSPIKDETFKLVVQNLACTDNDTIRIYVDRCLKDITGPIPQIITPNGDGANEGWIIPDVDYFKDNNLTIFNRWGNVVWEATPYNNQWEGKNQKNIDLPDGTYYYILNLNDANKKVYNGYVIIHR